MITLDFVSKLSGQKAKKFVGTFGLEIETEVLEQSCYPEGFLEFTGDSDNEGHMVFKSDMSYWTAKADGSLRNFGVEFILKEPLSLSVLQKALKEFDNKLGGVPFLKDQPSTSVHVHINMSHETLLTLANFGVIWFLFENILLDFCGEGRRSNLFATGIRHTEGQLEYWTKMLRGIEEGIPSSIVFNQQNVKYSSLNLGCLNKLGSLEVRSFRGTTDTSEIMDWVKILNKILQFSKTPGLTPSAFLNSYREKDVELLTDVFGEYSNRLKCDGFMDMIDRNLRYAITLSKVVKSWETFGMEFEKYKGERTKFKIKNLAESASQYAQVLEIPMPIPSTPFVINDEVDNFLQEVEPYDV